MCEDIRILQNEIAALDTRARKYEDWLLENSQAGDWFKEKTKYDDVLFRLDQKKQRLVAITSGNVAVPETITLPIAHNRYKGF